MVASAAVVALSCLCMCRAIAAQPPVLPPVLPPSPPPLAPAAQRCRLSESVGSDGASTSDDGGSPAGCCQLSFYHQHGGTCQSQPPDCDAYQWKIASKKLSDGEPLNAARLEQIFAEMDTDGSGSIDIPELRRALKGVCADTGPVLFMLSSADTNNDGNWDGKLSKEEFRSAMLGPG